MPLTATGTKILNRMMKQYAKKYGRVKGHKKGKQVFDAMEHEGKLTPKAFVKRGKKRARRRNKK